jgi:hypothetical protein
MEEKQKNKRGGKRRRPCSDLTLGGRTKPLEVSRIPGRNSPAGLRHSAWALAGDGEEGGERGGEGKKKKGEDRSEGPEKTGLGGASTGFGSKFIAGRNLQPRFYICTL